VGEYLNFYVYVLVVFYKMFFNNSVMFNNDTCIIKYKLYVSLFCSSIVYINRVYLGKVR